MTFRSMGAFLSRRAAVLRMRKLEMSGLCHFLANRLRAKALLVRAPVGVAAVRDSEHANGETGGSIKSIPREQCVGCGLCYALCPSNAISMSRDALSFVPKVDDASCTKCQRCFRVCPGINVLSYPGTLGTIQRMSVTHARDRGVRHGASSGGTCRSILIALLESKMVDKVIITRATDDPYVPETIMTSSIDDLRTDRLNSIYSPTSPLSALKELDAGLKYALVGLPCHIAGLSLAKAFEKSIFLRIGIFCSHTPSFEFVDAFLHDLPRSNEIRRVSYRGDGWPGKSTVYFRNGESGGIWFPAMWHKYNESRRYELPRCRTCTYYSAECADISIGDPWSLVRQDKAGSSLVFVRTARGQECMDVAARRVVCREIPPHQRQSILAFHERSATFKVSRRHVSLADRSSS